MRRRFQMAHMIDDTFMVYDADTGYILRAGLTKEACEAIYIALTAEEEAKVTPKDFTREEVEQEIYGHYPRKLGKKSGVDHLYRTLKNRKDFEKCKSACMTYAARCISESVEEKYVKHFSSWVKKWRDDLPDTAPKFDMEADTLTFL